jgi:peptidoglycan-associated lipoprotein
MKNLFSIIAVAAVTSWLTMSGCATQTYVQQQIAQAVDTKVGEIKKQVDANQREIAALKETAKGQNEQISTLSEKTEEVSSLAKEALARVKETNKLAMGKLLYVVTLTDESIHFAFDKSDLSKEAKAALDNFASRVKKENKNIFVEIQGHTDSTGSDDYNMKLGYARAEKVKCYLHIQHNIPLHRMNSISYGESKHVADNKTKSNRAKNRRITLVVIE